MAIVVGIQKDSPAKRLFRASTGLGVVAGILYFVWLNSPGLVSAAARPALQNFTVVSAAALLAVRDAATARCAGALDAPERTQDAESARAAMKLANDTLTAIAMPVNVREMQKQIDSRLAYAAHRYDEWTTTKCDPAAKPSLDKYAEDLMIDIDALRNPTGALAGGSK